MIVAMYATMKTLWELDKNKTEIARGTGKATVTLSLAVVKVCGIRRPTSNP